MLGIQIVKNLWHRYFVLISVLIVNLVTFQIGCLQCWSSPVIPMLDGTEDPSSNPLGKSITLSDGSLLASLYYIGAVFGTFFPMFMTKRFGRKWTLIILSIPCVANFGIYVVSNSLMVYFIATGLSGITMGGCMQIIPVYVGEISRCHHRGAMGCWFSIMLSLAQVFVFALGLTLRFREFNLVLFIFSVFTTLLLLIIEESPFYYMERGNIQKGEKILRKLRWGNSNEDIDKEMKDISKAIIDCNKKLKISDLFVAGPIRKSLWISLYLMVFQQLTLIGPLQSYTVTLFAMIGNDLTPDGASVIVTIFQLLGTIVVPFLIDRYGRKIIMLVTQAIVAATLFFIAIYFYLKYAHYHLPGMYWMPMIALILYNIFVNLGIGTVAFVVIGEIFPESAKDLTSSITILIMSIFSFLTIYPFPYMLEYLNGGNTFTIFGVCCVISLFVIYKMPETKGKTFWEIQEMLHSK